MTDTAIYWNSQLDQSEDAIVLGQIDMVPHLSLCMAVIDKSDLDAVKNSLATIEREHGGYQGKTVDIVHRKRRKKTMVALEFERDKEIMQIHKKVVKLLKKYAIGKAGTEALYRPGQNASGALNYILDFIDNYSGEEYRPHITLGHGQLNEHYKNENVQFPKLEIYQLGDHCTCRKKL